jgi:SAM-dependent methyltransferase/putative flippase GtrA
LKILKEIKKQDNVKTHTIGMLIVGATVWALYLLYANILTLGFGVNHFVAEITGIPLSWITNYLLNTRFNFGVTVNFKRFVVFCLISAFGWVIYLATTYIFTDILQWFSMVGTLIGVGTSTLSNIALQQAITFGKLAQGVKTGIPKSSQPDYDWKSYYRGNSIQKYWKHKITEYTMAMTNKNPVLEVGCGSSPLLKLINLKDKIGVDINLEKIKFIEKQDLSSKYIWYDGKRLPFGDNKFDTVICNEVIEHHPRPNELVKELSRVTHKNGVVIISTPDYASIRWNIIEVFYGLLMHSGYELEHGSKFTQTGLVALCNAYGMELKSVKRVFGCDMVCQFVKQRGLND